MSERGILRVTTVMRPKGSWRWQDRCAVRIVECSPSARGSDLRYKGVKVLIESIDIGLGTRRHSALIEEYGSRILKIVGQRAVAAGLEGMARGIG